MNPTITSHYLRHRADNTPAAQALRHAKFEFRYGTDDGHQARQALKKRDIMPSRYGLYEGEETTTLPNGWSLVVKIENDNTYNPLWEDCDSMGVVKESRGHPGDSYTDWIMNSDRGWYRYYDWKATLPVAIREGWGAPPYRTGSKQEQAMRAMKRTYEYLRAWCNDEWHYVGLIVELRDERGCLIGEDSCWGFESENISYVTSEARSWAYHLIRDARKAAQEQRRQEQISRRYHDAQNLGVTTI